MQRVPRQYGRSLGVLSLLFATLLPICASAKKSYWGHWIEIGSSGSSGGSWNYFVIDGDFDDGTDVNPGRFPDTGKEGGGTSKKIPDGKVTYPKTPGKGCTIPRMQSGAKGTAATKNIKVWVNTSLSETTEALFKYAAGAINSDQNARGNDFVISFTKDVAQATAYVLPSLPGASHAPGEFEARLYENHRNRGRITKAYLAFDSVPYDSPVFNEKRSQAARALAYALFGIDSIEKPDNNYPSVMDVGAHADASAPTYDPCTLAAINAAIPK